MPRNLQLTDEPGISNNLSNHKELPDTIYRENCIHIDGPNSIALGCHFSQDLSVANCQDQLRGLLSTVSVLFNTTISYKANRTYSEPVASLAVLDPPKAVSETDFRAAQVSESSQRRPQVQKSPGAVPEIPVTIFIAYARKDAELLAQLVLWLEMLKGQRHLNIEWNPGEITELWKLDIEDPLNAFDLVLLLFSPDFLASEYCRSDDMERAVKRHRNGGWVSPILLRPCIWDERLFGKLPILPSNRLCVSRWPNLDDAFEDIAAGIQKAVKYLGPRPRQ